MLDAATDTLLLIDLQPRLLPVIEGNTEVIANAKRLRDAALMLEVPLVYTEQNPKGLGLTIPELASNAAPVIRKMTFNAATAPDFPAKSATRPRMIVVGCEAHICVLQTVLGLIDEGREVARRARCDRLAAHGEPRRRRCTDGAARRGDRDDRDGGVRVAQDIRAPKLPWRDGACEVTRDAS